MARRKGFTRREFIKGVTTAGVLASLSGAIGPRSAFS